MSYVILAFFFLGLAIALPRMTHVEPLARLDPRLAPVLSIVAVIASLACVAMTSVVSIPANEVGVVRRLYSFSNLPEGRLIATNGEAGYQAEIIQPGTFRISPFFNVINRVEILPVVVIPTGFYGRIVARDGAPLPEGQIMADVWPDQDFSKFLNAEYFLTHGGQKGLQLSILKPGVYPVNLALFEIRIGYQANGKDVVVTDDDIYDIHGLRREQTPLQTMITKVPVGFVGVVRSTVQTKGKDCTARTAQTGNDGLTAELVPQGCKGIWNVSLPPNDYYLNRDAYDVTLVDTRLQVLEFKGGFTRRYLDLKVDSKGDFQQFERVQQVPMPEGAADQAVNTKIEGWEVPQELRALIQVSPENAAIVVAAVGGLQEIERRVIVPAIRSHVRNVFGGTISVADTDATGKKVVTVRPTHILDTIERRPALEEEILKLVQVDGRRAGVDVKEIRLGESAVPPELLLARQREQLAGQLKLAYIQEQSAQEQRQKTEQARATADRQPDLVRAQIGVQTARLDQDRRQAEGRAERLFLEEQAAGQTAQANVLGKDSVLRLQQTKMFFDLLGEHPELVKNLNLPRVMVTGGGNGLEGPAAILGSFLQTPASKEANQ